ncbi:MAG: hypothetical protein IH596_03910 [Bacteroidales bacterium]|nr:hypothetical protein [Bacteroidales bacterium]
MNEVNPSEIFKQVADALPSECRENIIIIGSLAAAYAYFGETNTLAVRTKDIDCLLRPYQVAAEKAQIITQQLFDAGWHRRKMGPHTIPGTQDTPLNELPAVRLYPPSVDPAGENAWFIEFLSEPESPKDQGKQWTRIVIDQGHFGLPSFRFLAITAIEPEKIHDLGIYCAQPKMMALANLLEHPEIKPERMSTPFEGQDIKRSNKDLGRVLAIGYLEEVFSQTDFREWGDDWAYALQTCFPDEWQDLANSAGKGLSALLSSDEDLEEASLTCAYGLLASYTVSKEELKEVGHRILGDAIETLRKHAT